MRMLVITSCTGKKRYDPKQMSKKPLSKEDFIDKEHLSKREKELADYACPAGEMYTGGQHIRLMEGIKTLRDHFGEGVVDLYIVSAGYGLISENKSIVPYNVTFIGMKVKEKTEWSRQIGIHDNLESLITKYDLVFFLLGEHYLRAIALPFDAVTPEQKLVFFASDTTQEMIPHCAPYYFINVCGLEDAKSLSDGIVALKGHIFNLLAQDAVYEDPSLFEKIYQDPNCILSLLEKHRKTA